MRKHLAIVATVLAGVLALSSVAYAAEPDQTTHVAIDGLGKLAAHGRGHVELEGNGWIRLAMHGDATITVGDDTKVRIRAIGEDMNVVEGSTTISLEDFTGVIVIRGKDIHVSATGRFRRIFAAGEGVAFLQGRGWYRATGGYFGTWTDPGLRVTYSL